MKVKSKKEYEEKIKKINKEIEDLFIPAREYLKECTRLYEETLLSKIEEQ